MRNHPQVQLSGNAWPTQRRDTLDPILIAVGRSNALAGWSIDDVQMSIANNLAFRAVVASRLYTYCASDRNVM